MLWDALADFEAARTDDALQHLMEGISGLVRAQRAYWLGGVRVNGKPVSDLAKG